jgi:cell division protein ZapA
VADVRLNIAGRTYDLTCADGEEPQLQKLAGLIDEKVRAIPGSTEVRQLLFAALMLADEAQEAKAKVDRSEPQSDSLRAAVALAESRETQARDELAAARREIEALKAAPPPAPAAAPRAAHDRALLQIADRIEALAAKVEQSA